VREQLVVELHRLLRLAPQQVHLRHRLLDQHRVFGALECLRILVQRFAVVALLPEGEAEVEVRELPVGVHLHLRGTPARACRGQLLEALGARLVDDEVRLGARQRRIELNRLACDALGVLVTAHVAEHESHQVVRVGILRVELDRLLERLERPFVHAAIVQRLADVEVDDGALRIEREGALQVAERAVQIPVGAFGEAELDERADVVGVIPKQRLELARGVGRLAEQRVRPPELPPRVAVCWLESQPLLQLRDALVVVAGVEVGDLEVALRDLHLLVELERAHERADGFLVQPLVVVQHPEVVVRPGVRRIDPPGERPQHFTVAFRGESRHDHGGWFRYATRTARRMACSDAGSGSNRKKPRSRSSTSVM